MSPSAWPIVCSAVANVTNAHPTREAIVAILRTGDGDPPGAQGHLVRALFEDCALETLQRLAMECGLDDAELRASMMVASARHAAVNADCLPEADGAISPRVLP